MILPILISVSVAPGSYFFCAWAAVATAIVRSPARLMDLAWLKTWLCIIVLPDVLAEGSGGLMWGSLASRRMQCDGSMHEWGDVASDGCAGIFRTAEEDCGSELRAPASPDI